MPLTIYRVGGIGEYGTLSFDNEWDAVEYAWRYQRPIFEKTRHPWNKTANRLDKRKVRV